MMKTNKFRLFLVIFVSCVIGTNLYFSQDPVQQNKSFEDQLLAQLQQSDLRGIDPYYILTVAVLETGHGKGATYLLTHNMFSITMGNHRAGEAFFAAHHWNKVYQTDQESIDDFINLISLNRRYTKAYRCALMDEHTKFFQALKGAGYAEDKNYAKKLDKIFEHIKGIKADERISINKSLVIGHSDDLTVQGVYK